MCPFISLGQKLMPAKERGLTGLGLVRGDLRIVQKRSWLYSSISATTT
jgi:hypothetical protein